MGLYAYVENVLQNCSVYLAPHFPVMSPNSNPHLDHHRAHVSTLVLIASRNSRE